jgi:hypothetical protein
MTRILAAFGILAVAAGLAFSTPAQPASARGMCGRHMHWVPAHRNRYGRWVRGHCAPNR